MILLLSSGISYFFPFFQDFPIFKISVVEDMAPRVYYLCDELRLLNIYLIPASYSQLAICIMSGFCWIVIKVRREHVVIVFPGFTNHLSKNDKVIKRFRKILMLYSKWNTMHA